MPASANRKNILSPIPNRIIFHSTKRKLVGDAIFNRVTRVTLRNYTIMNTHLVIDPMPVVR